MTALREPLLEALGVQHGFGTRGSPAPAELLRPRQVHGAAVVRAGECRRDPPPEADAVVAIGPGAAVGVVTADCVPLLLAGPGGRAVAAVHAGWRGLAAGVVEAGVAGLCRAADAPPARLRAAVGPHIGPCCYEVDGPVLDALEQRLGRALEAALRPSRAGHALLDLGALAAAALRQAGLVEAGVGRSAALCTRCDPERFHSYRRDGPRAGRLLHFIAPNAPEA